MMTKDKKPFTYTPGGLDLSQIKSPRMARRVNRNAHAEGVTEVPKISPLAHHPPGPLPPAALAAMQPNLPVAVFPSGGIPPPPPPPSSQSPMPPPPPPIQNNKPMQENKSPTYYQRPDIKSIIPPNPTAMLRPTGGPHRRDVDDQNDGIRNNKPQLGTLYIPPMGQSDEYKSPPRNIQSPPSRPVDSPVLNKAPTPWLTQRQQQPPQVPAWAHKGNPEEQYSPVSPKVSPQERRSSDNEVQFNQKPVQYHIEQPPAPRPQGIQFQHKPQQMYLSQPQQQAPKGTRIIPIQFENNSQPTHGVTVNVNSSKVEK